MLTEDNSGGANETATATLSIADVDASDTHTVSVSYNTDANWSGGTLSAVQIAAISSTTTNFTADSDSWDYSVANSDIQFLAETETITLTFTVTATDDSMVGTPGMPAPNEDDSDSETVTITINGTNDIPDAVDDTHSGVTEDDTAAMYDVLTNDTDVDLSDVLSVIEVQGNTTLTGQLSQFGATLSGDAGGLITYNATTSAYLQTLGTGESLTVVGGNADTYDYTITDGNSGTDSATVSVEVSGVDTIEIDMNLIFPDDRLCGEIGRLVMTVLRMKFACHWMAMGDLQIVVNGDVAAGSSQCHTRFGINCCYRF